MIWYGYNFDNILSRIYSIYCVLCYTTTVDDDDDDNDTFTQHNMLRIIYQKL